MTATPKNAYSRKDLSSHSNPFEVMSLSLSLHWTIDFSRGVLSGKASHSMKIVSPGATHAKFDSSGCHIARVLLNEDLVAFQESEVFKGTGCCISVGIPPHLRREGEEFDVTFEYETDKDASAVQWLDAVATRSGKHPFVFTQCQAIHARSLMPCQDTPGVKTPYTATVVAPDWCVVLMSALQQGDPTPADTPTFGSNSNEKWMKYSWIQPVPCCSYLVALAAGELESRSISDRVKVWAEPKVVDDAAFEFSETEDFLRTAESLTCPYMWQRYDVLCLPPSFPYGGMENPCLTFATPTLLAGDKSLASVIAHEIAHSWTGNLVTNCTWEHFWLNEGWTVWLERKIMSRVKNDINHLKMSAQLGWKALEDDVMRYEDQGLKKFTQLVWPLTGEDPDEAFSRVPYEKGFNFLYYLEGLVGTNKFERFAKEYLDNFKFTTVSSGEFKDFFLSKFSDVPSVASIDWDAFFYGQGMPPINPDFGNPLQDAAESLAEKWIRSDDTPVATQDASKADIKDWDSQQICIFLNRLLHYAKSTKPLSIESLTSMDRAYSFTTVENSEIKFCWQMLCLQSDYQDIIPHIVSFITTQGRMKFVRPLYKALVNSAVGSAVARKTFQENYQLYHPICKKMIAQDLGVDIGERVAPSNSYLNTSKTAYVVPLIAAAVAGVAVVAYSVLKKR